MAGAPTEEIVLGQPQKMTARIFIKDVVFDPGIVYSVADALLFAKTNPVGFIACLGATGAAVTLKTLGITQPQYLTKYSKLTEIALDSRTPLRCSGMALLVVGGVSVATGAVLPAVSGFLLAVGNFRLAQSISDAKDAKKAAALRKEQGIEEPAEEAAPQKRNTLQRLLHIGELGVKRPDLYINAGFAAAGLMAGGAALFVLPIVAISFGVSMRNILKEEAEHRGHPKAITAGAAYTFAGIGVLEGHGLIALAHAINASVLADAERRVTPGGISTIVQDTKYGLMKLFRLDKRKEEIEDGPIPIPFSAQDLGEEATPPLFNAQSKLGETFAAHATKNAAAQQPTLIATIASNSPAPPKADNDNTSVAAAEIVTKKAVNAGAPKPPKV